MNLEVLVATMNQKDLSKYYDMNINSDVIFANQAKKNDYTETIISGNKIKMITTTTVGVGKNRNIALSRSSADIILFADDDIVYIDNYKEKIIKAFEEIPEADVIIFGMDIIKNNNIQSTICNKTKRVNILNSFKYGTCVLAIKRNSLLKANLSFSELFGGGCIYGSGEDSLFISDCFKSKLKVYTHELILGKTYIDKSSWFTGYNEKYFYDKGAWIASAFPNIKYFMLVYFIIRFTKLTDLNTKTRAKFLLKGMSNFKNLISYQDYIYTSNTNIR